MDGQILDNEIEIVYVCVCVFVFALQMVTARRNSSESGQCQLFLPSTDRWEKGSNSLNSCSNGCFKAQREEKYTDSACPLRLCVACAGF